MIIAVGLKVNSERAVQDRLFMSDFDKYMLELEGSAKHETICVTGCSGVLTPEPISDKED